MPVRRSDGQWPTLDAAERAIRQPGPFRAIGLLRDQLLSRRGAAALALERADRELAALMTRRGHLVERIEGCNLALVGTGQVRDPATGELLQQMSWHKRIPFTDAQPLVDEQRVKVVSGRTLSAATTELLQGIDRVLTIPEIERLLRLQGLVTGGRASHAISSALRGEVRSGRIERVWRGCYRAA
jgi:hypothetical protein